MDLSTALAFLASAFLGTANAIHSYYARHA